MGRWRHRCPVVAGCVTSSGTTITVAGAGTDIGGTSDEFHFAYLPASGDLDVRVKVASLENVDPSAKAGIMIRESLQDDARHAFMFVTPGNGLAFERRVKQGRMAAQTSRAPPRRQRLGALGAKGQDVQRVQRPTPVGTWTLVGSSDGQYGLERLRRTGCDEPCPEQDRDRHVRKP